MSYSTPWLRLGLETVFGELIPQTASMEYDVASVAPNSHLTTPTRIARPQSMSRLPMRSTHHLSNRRHTLAVFIANRLLFDPELAGQFAHPTVPEMYRDGFAVSLKQFTLKKFVRLVAFLDGAKMARLVPGDPCLFNINGSVKESREFFNLFSRELLKGEGDFNKHLGYFGIIVTHKQDSLQE